MKSSIITILILAGLCCAIGSMRFYQADAMDASKGDTP